jgi:hypothetical protein
MAYFGVEDGGTERLGKVFGDVISALVTLSLIVLVLRAF